MSTLPNTQLEELEHMSRTTSNYDLNIWDRLSYETEGAEEGGWEINVYTIVSQYGGDDEGWYFMGFGYGEQLEDKTITLTPDEAKRLTLGWEPELGGEYCADSDFWLDQETFLNIYNDVPERVANLLWALPEYELKGNRLPIGKMVS
jgi:hypothetical protein